MEKSDQLQELLERIRAMETKWHRELVDINNNFLAEIRSLKEEFAQVQNELEISAAEKPLETTTATQKSASQPNVWEALRQPAQENLNEPSITTNQSSAEIQTEQTNRSLEEAPINKASTRQPIPVTKNPSIVMTFIRSLALAPFEALIDQGRSIYDYYDKKEQLPIFLMTLGGIIFLVLSAGFGLQYSWSSFSPFLKLLTTWTLVIGIIGLGYKLANTELFKDFGSALASAGIILSLLSCYYTHTLLTSHSWVFILSVLAIASFSLILAVRIDARILAILGFSGAILAPYSLGQAFHLDSQYIFFVDVLLLIGLIFSKRLRFDDLFLRISFAVLFVALESQFTLHIIEQGAIQIDEAFAIGFSIAFYILNYFLFFEGSHIKSAISKSQFYIALTIAALYIFNLASFTNDIKIANHLLLAFIGFAFISISLLKTVENQNARLLTLTLASLFLAAWLIETLSYDIATILIGLESLLLVWIGFRFDDLTLRAEGFLAFFLLQLKTMFFFITGFEISFFQRDLLNTEFWQFAILSLYLLPSSLLLTKNHLSKQDDYAFSFNFELVCLNSSLLLLSVSTYFWGAKGFLISSLLCFWCLSFAYLCHLRLGKLLAYLNYLILPCLALFAALSVGSFSFTKQPWYGNLARLLSVGYLFLMPWFMSKALNLNLENYALARWMKKVFFMLLPVLFIPSVFRRQPELLPAALAISTLISYFLLIKIKENYLKNETITLGIVACLFACALPFGQFLLSSTSSYINFLVLTSSLLALAFLEHKKASQALQALHNVAWWYSIALVGLLALDISSNWYSTAVSCIVYLLMVYRYKEKLLFFAPVSAGVFSFLLLLTWAVLYSSSFDKSPFSLSLAVFMLVAWRWLLDFEKPVYPLNKVQMWHVGFFASILGLMLSGTSMWDAGLASFLLITQAILIFLDGKKLRYPDAWKAALTVAGLVMVKLFFFDLAHMQAAAKILTFIIISLLLLVVAFVLNRQQRQGPTGPTPTEKADRSKEQS